MASRRRRPSGSWVADAAYRLGDVVGRAFHPLQWVSRLFEAEDRPPRSGDLRDRRRPSTAPRRIMRRRDRAPLRPRTGAAMSDAAQEASALGLRGLSGELSSPDPYARQAALETVGELAEERASRILLAALHDPDAGVRSAAAAAAARARASSMVFSLILALDDPAAEVRLTAAMAIEEIADTRVDLSEDADAATRQRVIAELKRWWKQQRLAQLVRGAGQENEP